MALFEDHRGLLQHYKDMLKRKEAESVLLLTNRPIYSVRPNPERNKFDFLEHVLSLKYLLVLNNS